MLGDKKKSGFTLIELLVVIAIIAILAAILFPVFGKAKEAGRQTKCLNNFKQINNALLMYVDTWDSRLPGYKMNAAGTLWGPHHCKALDFAQNLRDWNTAGRFPYMQDLLASFSKGAGIWACPSINLLDNIPAPDPWYGYPADAAGRLKSKTWADNTGNFLGKNIPTTYGWSWMHVNRSGTLSQNCGQRTSMICSPSKATMFIEMPWWSTSKAPHTRGDDMGVHLSYFDGHAQFKRPPGRKGTWDMWCSSGWVDSPRP